MVEVYADVVFLINLLMNIFIFWITSKLIKRKILFRRLFLGGFISSLLFCLFIFVSFLIRFYNIFTMMFVLIAGLFAAFSPKNIKELLKLIVLSNISAFCVGGMGVGLFFYTNLPNLIGNMVDFYVEDFSLKLLLIISSTTYIVIKLSIGWLKRVLIKKQKFYNAKIYMEDKIVDLMMLVDTGNSLHDPITKTPVIIAEFNSIKSFLPNDLKVIYYEKKEEDFNQITACQDFDFIKRIRVIPYASLGKQNGILFGFRADKLEINMGEKSLETNDVIIGIYNFKLSKNDHYQGLLNPELISK